MHCSGVRGVKRYGLLKRVSTHDNIYKPGDVDIVKKDTASS